MGPDTRPFKRDMVLSGRSHGEKMWEKRKG